MSAINGINAFDLLCEDLVFIRASFKRDASKLYDYKIHRSQLGANVTREMLSDEATMSAMLVGRYATVLVKQREEWADAQHAMTTVQIEEIVMRGDKDFNTEYGTRFIVQLIDEAEFERLNDIQSQFVRDFNRERNKAVQAQIMTAMFGGDQQLAEFQSKLTQLTGDQK